MSASPDLTPRSDERDVLEMLSFIEQSQNQLCFIHDQMLGKGKNYTQEMLSV